MSSSLRTTVLTGSILALAALSACGGPQLDDAPAPPSGYLEPAPPPPPRPDWRPAPEGELLGGPQRDDRGEIYEDHGFGTMAPIPNPEDLDEESRRMIYGDTPPRPQTEYSEEDTAPVAEAAPPPRRERQRPRPQERTRSHSAETAKTARAPGPVTSPAAAPTPAATAAAAQKPAPAPSATAPANIDTVAEALGSAVAGDVTSGATLDVPQTVRQGQPGVVVLTLPKTLLERLQTEAQRLGLTEAARQVDVLAILSAEGYDIVPTTEQSARLADKAATSLSWKVTPKPGERTPLQALVSGELKGAEKPTPFWIAVVEQPDATAATRRDDDRSSSLDLPGMPLVTVPGFGQVRSGVILLFGFGLLIVILLAAAARRAHERRRAKEREVKSRRLAEFAKAKNAPSAEPPAGTSEQTTPADKAPKDV